MKTIILMLLVNLSFEIMVNASTINNVEKRRHFVEKDD